MVNILFSSRFRQAKYTSIDSSVRNSLTDLNPIPSPSPSPSAYNRYIYHQCHARTSHHPHYSNAKIHLSSGLQPYRSKDQFNPCPKTHPLAPPAARHRTSYPGNSETKMLLNTPDRQTRHKSQKLQGTKIKHFVTKVRTGRLLRNTKYGKRPITPYKIKLILADGLTLLSPGGV